MKRFLLLLAGCFSGLYAQSSDIPRPKLVIGIVVDQMRWDYLYRYYDHFGTKGFKRLLNNGFRCEQTLINYLPSYTAPGHTCIYTGSVPAIHGITGNFWVENSKTVYCTDDKTVFPVGGSYVWGQMSPRSMLTTTVTDELRLATNFRSRVYGISLKDRSSIFPAGHLANGAYWFDDSAGRFSTSSYYRDKLPEWVERFNARHSADSILSQNWELLDDPVRYKQSIAANSRYEGKFSSKASGAGLPHKAGFFVGSGSYRYTSIRKVPAGNWITLQMAKQCIASNRLGQYADPDFLCVSLSATDYAGHQFGPNSMEVEDMYVRLDKELARFLTYLDDQVGAGEYTVFLTADHGVAHNSLFLEDSKIPAGNVSESAWLKELNAYLKSFSGTDKDVLSLENYQVYLNPAATSDKYPEGDAKAQVIKWLKSKPEVSTVIDLEEPRRNYLMPELITQLCANGYYPPRCGVVQLILKPGYYAGYAPTGTTHGTWNPYDTHIPLVFYGWGIRKGETHREIHMTDIAPTIAALLHIQMPNGNVGKVITEVVP